LDNHFIRGLLSGTKSLIPKSIFRYVDPQLDLNPYIKETTRIYLSKLIKNDIVLKKLFPDSNTEFIKSL
jgi:hypothetical protein